MYEYLADAVAQGHVVTANRRLARKLREVYDESQVAVGRAAWQSPAIFSWPAWLRHVGDSAASAANDATRINAHQSRLLWEQCLALELPDSLVNIGNLARIARDSWARLQEWSVSVDECSASARGQDQHLFAGAARRYAQYLDERGWIDDATTPEWITALIAANSVELPGRVTFCGFDQVSPTLDAVTAALNGCGVATEFVVPASAERALLCSYDNPDAELRAAGEWARKQLESEPGLQVAVVVNNLEQDASRCARLIREGFVPGWQVGGDAHDAAVDVSYGQSLATYPAIHAALLALRWTNARLTSADISVLLRSRYFGAEDVSGRCRLELRLRDMPDRQWTMASALGAMRGRDKTADAEDWLQRFADFQANFAERGSRRSPADLAKAVDQGLTTLQWPGAAPLSSDDFQLVDRWRELLNELARLELVAKTLTAAEAVARITHMATETVFQPERKAAALTVLGPLEAAGMSFDRLWVTGAGADDWPPVSRPLALVSRELQRDRGMPDATPEDTADYAARVLGRLRASAPECVFSYAESRGDEQQLPTALLSDLGVSAQFPDPGWHAATLGSNQRVNNVDDAVPEVAKDEILIGGASTLNRQLTEPFAAFAFGRLGVRWLQPFTPGVAANVRGSIVHDALARLYSDKPSLEDIRLWQPADLRSRVERAVEDAFSPHERHADSMLANLLLLERDRTTRLAEAVVEYDRLRDSFQIIALEQKAHASIGEIQLQLRCDRIDRLPTGELVILDYKTGATKRFLRSGEPDDMQLVVYACIAEAPVAAIGLYNVDSRAINIDGAGPGLGAGDGWDETLGEWMHTVHAACAEIARGDVRVNALQASSDARPLALLSRFAEIRRER